eukprot:5202277-Amphidinium_carterae.1
MSHSSALKSQVVECDVYPLQEDKVVKWINGLARQDEVELPAEEPSKDRVECLVELTSGSSSIAVSPGRPCFGRLGPE